MSYLLLHPETWSPGGLAPALEAARVEARPVRRPEDLAPNDRPTVFLLDVPGRDVFSAGRLRAFVDAGGAIVALARPDEHDVPDLFPTEILSGFLAVNAGTRQLLVALRAGYREAAARHETARARNEAALRSREIGELTRIGVALGTERDLDTLLDLILTQARRVTQSDAGSLYLVEAPDGNSERQRLLFKLAQTQSKPDVPLVTFTMPMDRTSLAGYAATTGDPLVIDDAYFLPPDVEYTINRSFDERYGYRTKSMLVIPMKDHKDDVIGVLQLINRKRDGDAILATPADVDAQVVPYSKRTVELVTALAGQAGVAIENSKLYKQIENMFETFVNAAVLAIEQRDPTTEGHSRRVADYTVGLAKVVDRVTDGPFRGLSFSRQQIREIKYAGLLHDFGKVGVREKVLVKAKKLYGPDLELIRQRHAFVHRTLERDFWKQRVEFLEKNGAEGEGYQAFIARIETDLQRELGELDRFLEMVIQSNEPSLLPAEHAKGLTDYAQQTYVNLEGQTQPLLTPDEVRFLTIPKGSLDESERLEIESHVTHTFNFLQQIPWTPELAEIPVIAFGHHEKLDGTGYPKHKRADEIPPQTRMMTISDIYDALTAQDRPYKRAVPPTRALDIMSQEVTRGQLDKDLFRVFVDAKVYETPG